MKDKQNKQAEIAKEALRLVQEQAPDQSYLEHQSDTPDPGAITGPNPAAPTSGALDAEGHRPVLERSRKVR